MTLETRVRVARSRAGTIGAYKRLAKYGAVAVVRPAQEAATTALNARLIAENALDTTAPDFADRLGWARSAHFRQMRMKRS